MKFEIKLYILIFKVFLITKKELMSKNGCNRIARARTAFCKLARVNTDYSLKHIASLIGKTDHTTAIYYINLHEDTLYKYDKYYKCKFDRLTKHFFSPYIPTPLTKHLTQLVIL